MGPFEKHVFVCTAGNSCPQQGAASIHTFLKEAVAKGGLRDRIRVNHAGCLDQCGHGPLVVVYPDNVWYAHVTIEEAELIFREHLVNGCSVDHLQLMRTQAGANKLPRTPDGLPTTPCATCRDGQATTVGLVDEGGE